VAETVAVKTRFTYNPRTLRYRDNASGRFVRGSTVKRATFAVVKGSRAEMRRLTNDMIARRMDLGEWQDRFAAEVKNLHTSLAMAGAGGMASMTPSDWGRVGQRLRFEYSRLANSKRPQREGCENVSLLGWVKLGTLPAVGSRVCISNCKCTLAFRRTKPRVPQ
jgi:hypothetical protein